MDKTYQNEYMEWTIMVILFLILKPLNQCYDNHHQHIYQRFGFHVVNNKIYEKHLWYMHKNQTR